MQLRKNRKKEAAVGIEDIFGKFEGSFKDSTDEKEEK